LGLNRYTYNIDTAFMKLTIHLSELKQSRLSGRSIAADFIVPKIINAKTHDISEIDFDLKDIKAINQSFYNEILEKTFSAFPNATIYPSNAENPELILKFNDELTRIKNISTNALKSNPN
jgi:hypothetical protein